MIDIFAWYCEKRHHAVKEWKAQTGKKVYGYFCCVTPEEILFAADILPVRITGTGEPLQCADVHIPPNSCPFARSCFDAGMQGQYDYLDGVIVPNTCDIIFAMEYFWKNLVPRSTKPALIAGVDLKPFVHYINFPTKVTGRQVAPYYVEVLRSFKQEIERCLDRSISDEDLEKAISVYNGQKTQMRRMYEMRKFDPPALSGYDAWQITYASLMMPKDEHATALKTYLDEIELKRKKTAGGVRIYLLGSVMDHVNAEIYKVIEQQSAIVVSDDLCVGTRSFWYYIEEDIPPLEAIARRSLNTACPRSTVTASIPENRWEHILRTIEGFHVEGAIYYVLKCCDARLSEFPLLKNKFKNELGIPVLALEGDYTVASVEQIRSQVEAFIEMIEG